LDNLDSNLEPTVTEYEKIGI